MTTTKTKTADAPDPVGAASPVKAALAQFHRNLPKVGKDNTAEVKSEKGRYTYRYADLSEISPVVLPLLAEVGLTWLAKPTFEDDRFVLRYTLTHAESGDEVTGTWPLPDPRSAPQALGSATTYARRYTLCAVTGIAPGADDDDAQAAAEAAANRPAPRPADDSRRPASRQAAPMSDTEAAFAALAATCDERGWDSRKVAARYRAETGCALASASMREIEEFRRALVALPADATADLVATPADDEPSGAE